MIDNQVHDNWDSINTVQTRFDRQWYESMRRPKGVRTFGNGPCPALGDQGCRIKKCRPITCTTQLCSKMLVVLNDFGVIRSATHTALQIEDLVGLPDILPDLYGTRRGPKVSLLDVEAYLSEVQRTKEKFARAIKTRDQARRTPHCPDFTLCRPATSRNDGIWQRGGGAAGVRPECHGPGRAHGSLRCGCAVAQQRP